MRHLPAACATNQLCLTGGLAHFDNCLRASEEARQMREHIGVGVVYYELKRLDWQEKSKSIPDFHIEADVLKYDEEFVKRAKVVLQQRI